MSPEPGRRSTVELMEQLREGPARIAAATRELSAVAWERRATVTGTGSQREWTVYANVERLARHEGVHVQQLGRIMRSLR